MAHDPVPPRIVDPPPLDEPQKPKFSPRGVRNPYTGQLTDRSGRVIRRQTLDDGTEVDEYGRPTDLDKHPIRQIRAEIAENERLERQQYVKPCAKCGAERPVDRPYVLEMSPVKALLVQQCIEQGFCIPCAVEKADSGLVERAARQLRAVDSREPRWK